VDTGLEGSPAFLQLKIEKGRRDPANTRNIRNGGGFPSPAPLFL